MAGESWIVTQTVVTGWKGEEISWKDEGLGRRGVEKK